MQQIAVFCAPSFPEYVVVNNTLFHCTKNQQGRQVLVALEKRKKMGGTPIYVQPLLIDASYRELPTEIWINNKLFSRKIGTCYIPKYATISELARFFDSIAPIYHKITLAEVNETIISLLLRTVIPKNENAVALLDFGVGMGLSAEVVRKEFPAKSIYLHGVDISGKMVATSKQKGIKAHRTDGFSIPFPHDYFDGIFASFVVHYFQSFEPFSEMYRVLKPQGVLAFNLRRPSEDWQQRYENELEGIGFCNLSWYSGSMKLQSDGAIYSEGYPYTIVQVQKPWTVLDALTEARERWGES